jgi:hypothetical protein
MKTIGLLLIISLLTLMGCEKIDKDCPDCILKRTREFIKSQTCDTGASVSEWVFQGEHVYMFADGTCGADYGASVLNQYCEFVGNLGGFSGALTINGINFYQNATLIKTIWKQD